jgi:hypothetical protein
VLLKARTPDEQRALASRSAVMMTLVGYAGRTGLRSSGIDLSLRLLLYPTAV